MHVYRVGNTEPVCVGLHHRRGRSDWDPSFGYTERCDSQKVAQIFSRAHERIGFVVYSTPDFCQVRVTKRSTLQPLNSSK
jgi:hypothetical protein